MAYNVLIVDDSNIVRKVLIKTFGLTDVSVNHFLEAENGLVALDLLKQNWVDLIFLDINMPVMDGMTFIREMAKDNENKSVPVVVVSTEGSTERKEELARAGIKAYLRKPVTPEQLVSVITSVLGENNVTKS